MIAPGIVPATAYVSIPNGNGTRSVAVLAGTASDGSMFFTCDPASPSDACADVDGHATIHADVRDRLHVTVRTDDGRSHSHDFKLEGGAYALWPAGIEMELKRPSETRSFTAYAAGTYRFVCEIPGHEARGMWGALVVA